MRGLFFVFAMTVLGASAHIAKASDAPPPENASSCLYFFNPPSSAARAPQPWLVAVDEEMERHKAEIEKTAQRRIVELREKQGELARKRPLVLNTYTYLQRSGMSWLLRVMLTLNLERMTRSLIEDYTNEYRDKLKKHDRLGEQQQRLRAEFERKRPPYEPFDQILKIKDLETARADLRREVGGELWFYTGIVTTLLQVAKLIPESGPVLEGVDRALIQDRVMSLKSAFAPLIAVEESISGKPATAQPSEVIALRVLKALGIVDSHGKQLSPSLDDVVNLINSDAVIREGKMEDEYNTENKRQRYRPGLELLANPTANGMLFNVLDWALRGKLSKSFPNLGDDVKKAATEANTDAMVIQFLDNASVTPNTDVGNNLLAEILWHLIEADGKPTNSDDSILVAIAREPLISSLGFLKRARESKLAQEEVWGDDMTFADVIKGAEAKRHTLGLRSAIIPEMVQPRTKNKLQRSLVLVASAGALSALSYIPWSDVVANYGGTAWNFLKDYSALLAEKAIGYRPWQ